MSPTQLCIRIPQGSVLVSPFSSCPSSKDKCTWCIKLLRAWLQQIEHNCSQWWALYIHRPCATKPPSHQCIREKNRQHHRLAVPKDRVPRSVCHPGWATEFDSEVAAGDGLSLGSSGSWQRLPYGRELWWKLLATVNCLFELVGPFIPCARCCLLTFSTAAWKGLAISTLWPSA